MPKIIDHDHRRAQIAKAAAHAIADMGIAVKMKDLASSAECTTGALPHYFGSKDDILIAALHHVNATMQDRALQTSLATNFDAVAILLSILPAGERRRREWLVWLAFIGRAPYARSIADEFEIRYQTAGDMLKILLQLLQERGELSVEMDLDLASESIVAFLDGIGIRATLEPEAWPESRLQRHVERHLALMGYCRKNHSSTDEAEAGP